MAASSNYKTYARQTRMLTEEAGFAGGMMWTDNTIDATHLKNIVNFDYDETTTFLKTRDPFVNTPVLDADNKPISTLNTSLLGVYTISAVQEDDSLTQAGRLYVIGHAGTASYTATLLYFINDQWHVVRPSQDYSTVWSNSIKLKFIQHDNTLYTTVQDDTQVLQAYQLHCSKRVNEVTGAELEVKYFLEAVPYTQALVDSVSLAASLANGWNAARGVNMFNYHCTVAQSKDATPMFSRVMLRSVEDPTVVLSQPVLKQAVYLDIILDNIQQGTSPIVNVFKLMSGDADSLDALWYFVDTASVIAPTTEQPYYTVRLKYEFIDQNTVLGFSWVSTQPSSNPKLYADDNLTAPLIDTYGYAPTSKASVVKPYLLPTAQALCLWNDRLVLWDLIDNKHTLFISAVDNFYYFPTPNNVAVFETDIINCIPYLGDLLVFTADKIHRLAIDSSGVITNTVIQNDMPISKEDASCLRVIKNMVLFKSGNYFYMVVPKSQSLTGELTIAPVYKNIAGLLNDKKQYVFETLSAMYPHKFNVDEIYINDVPEHVYAEQDTIHILYEVRAVCKIIQDGVLLPKQTLSFTLFLNYNTNLRAWSAYIEETSSASLIPAVLTAARDTEFLRIDPHGYIYTAIATPNYSLDNAVPCLLDTGYRNLSGTVKKRFREIQLKLYSGTENITVFNSAFYLDGQARKCYNKLEEAFVDTAQRTVTLAPAFEPNAFLLEDTIALDKYGNLVSQNEQQGSDIIELSNWQLDFSHFKRNAVSTLRIPVSGKGYSPRFILMSEQGIALYINEINWVYRMLYGR